MRKCLIALICFCSTIQSRPQGNANDSLRNLITSENNDTANVKRLVFLSRMLLYSPDSAVKYAQQALKLAQHAEDEKGEIDALVAMSNARAAAGDYSGGLRAAFDALKKAEHINDTGRIWRSLWIIGGNYDKIGDAERALQYELKVLSILRRAHDELALTGSIVNVGNGYLSLNKLDSARMFIDEALERALRVNDSGHIGGCYLNLGIIYTRMRLYGLAKNYLRVSLPYFPNDNRLISFAKWALSNAFDSTGPRDSSFYYARESYRGGQQLRSPEVILPPATHLVSLFRKANQPDSALFYQDMVIQLKDSISSNEKERQIESLNFQEQLRQMDLAKEKSLQRQERVRNLQTAAVALFIPLFLGLVLIMSRKQIRPRAVEFLGVLFLLFVFEFITLFAHPFVSKWTNESQIWMLLIFVGVALILVPLHDRSERWLKKQLAIQRNRALQRRVRLGHEAQKKLES